MESVHTKSAMPLGINVVRGFLLVNHMAARTYINAVIDAYVSLVYPCLIDSVSFLSNINPQAKETSGLRPR